MSEVDKEVDKKATKKASKGTGRGVKEAFVRGILGIVLLLVFGSIAFSTLVIWWGSNSSLYRAATVPAALFDIVLAFVAFSKILK